MMETKRSFKTAQKTDATTRKIWTQRPDQVFDAMKIDDRYNYWTATEDMEHGDAKRKTIGTMTRPHGDRISKDDDDPTKT
jgi:hypothetical protein